MSKVLIQGDWLDGFSSGRKAALLDWEHKRDARAFVLLCNTLRTRRWRLAHPDKAKALNRRMYVEKRQAEYFAKRDARYAEHRARAVESRCERCGATWCDLPGRRGRAPRFCGPACQWMHAHELRVAKGAKR